MARKYRVAVAAGSVHIAFTDRNDGDFRVDGGAQAESLRRSQVDARWTWLVQTHGNNQVTVTHPGEWAGAEADAAVTVAPWCPVAVTTADCAPVVLVAHNGLAVVHAGWKGIVNGVISGAAQRLAELGAVAHSAMVGPCISPLAYEFADAEMELVVSATDESVVAQTSWGTQGLDLARAASIAVEQSGWPAPQVVGECTSGQDWFSYRTRGDTGRQTTVAWYDNSLIDKEVC